MVFVLSNERQPLDPCHEARARQLLKAGKAAVFRRFPFTIILKKRSAAESETHVYQLKLDPGSKTTGIAIFYTALTLAVGVFTWVYSALKFQADMGVMLTFMFLVNMIAAIIFLPALCRFILRPREKDDFVPPV